MGRRKRLSVWYTILSRIYFIFCSTSFSLKDLFCVSTQKNLDGLLNIGVSGHFEIDPDDLPESVWKGEYQRCPVELREGNRILRASEVRSLSRKDKGEDEEKKEEPHSNFMPASMDPSPRPSPLPSPRPSPRPNAPSSDPSPVVPSPPASDPTPAPSAPPLDASTEIKPSMEASGLIDMEKCKEELDLAFEELKLDHQFDRDSVRGWIKVKSKGEVDIFRRVSKKKGQREIHSFKGRGIIHCDVDRLVQILAELHKRSDWDPLLKCGEVIARIDEHTTILRHEYETKRCLVSVHRDFLFLEHWKREDDGKHLIVALSDPVEQTLVPVPPKCSRGHVFISGWVLEPTIELGKKVTRVTYLTNVDLKGLPTSIINLASMEAPLLIHRINEILK